MKNEVFWDKNPTSYLTGDALRLCYRFEIFTAVTMKYAVLWDIKSQFVPHRTRIRSPLQIHPVNAK
jgi:hypothetical protein